MLFQHCVNILKYPFKIIQIKWQIQVKSMYNHFHNLCFCSLAKTLISLAMFNFYFILIKDLETQCDVLYVFFPTRKSYHIFQRHPEHCQQRLKSTLLRKLYWGKYYKHKHTCTFSSFLLKLIAPRKRSVSFCIVPQASPLYKDLHLGVKYQNCAKNSWPAGRHLGSRGGVEFYVAAVLKRRKLEEDANPFSPRLSASIQANNLLLED